MNQRTPILKIIEKYWKSLKILGVLWPSVVLSLGLSAPPFVPHSRRFLPRSIPIHLLPFALCHLVCSSVLYVLLLSSSAPPTEGR